MGKDYPQLLCNYLVKRFQIPEDSWLLDVGYGGGEHLMGFLNNNILIMGVEKEDCDLNYDMLPFPDGGFDAVFSKSVMEHLANPANAIREIKRVLTDDGLAIIMIPTYNRDFFKQAGHITAFSKPELKRLFPNTEIEIFYQLPFVWRYPILKFIPILIRYFLPFKTRKSMLIWHSKEPMWLINTSK